MQVLIFTVFEINTLQLGGTADEVELKPNILETIRFYKTVSVPTFLYFMVSFVTKEERRQSLCSVKEDTTLYSCHQDRFTLYSHYGDNSQQSIFPYLLFQYFKSPRPSGKRHQDFCIGLYSGATTLFAFSKSPPICIQPWCHLCISEIQHEFTFACFL